MKIVGTLMVRADRPSFEWVFPLHLDRLLPLVDEMYVRVDRPGAERVIPFLEHPKIHWDYQNVKDAHHHAEDKERQALLDWALSTDATWCFAFDSDEVLEEGAAEALRDFLEAKPAYRILMFPLSYSSHHRDGYVLNRDETSVSAGRGFRLDDPEIRNFKYVGDKDGLHCGTLPSQDKRAAVLKEIVTVHYHATTPEEWMFKRSFYDGTWHVGKYGGIETLYPPCGEPPYSCDRFGKEANAHPLSDTFASRPERFARLMARVGKERAVA